MAKRGRPKKATAEQVAQAEAFGLPDDHGLPATFLGETLPEPRIGGRPNPEYFRRRRVILAGFKERLLTAGSDASLPKGVTWRDLEQDEDRLAEAHGFNPRHLVDARSEGEKFLDAVERLRQSADAIFELADTDLAAIEKGFDFVDRDAEAYLEGRAKDARTFVGKFRTLLGRLRRVRERAREECPRGGYRPDRLTTHALRAAHLLRQMLYVDRAATQQNEAQVGRVLMFSRAHVKAAVDIYLAERSIAIQTDEDRSEIRESPLSVRCEGIVVMMPPEHGKTTIARAWCRDVLRRDRREIIRWLHAADDVAIKEVEAVKAAFNPEDGNGRRWLSLFPDMTTAKEDKNKGNFRLALDSRSTDPSMSASGVGASRLGVNCSKQVWDDVVPQKDEYEAAERDRRYNKLVGTWKTRVRGSRGFVLMMGYPWHEEDALWRVARNGRRLNFTVSMQACGGPPSFRPVDPNIYPSSRLRRVYAESPTVYARNFQMRAQSDARRIISALRLYDPESPEHARFLNAAREYLSLDPAGTNREGADKAGILHAAVGVAVVERDDVEIREQQGRVLPTSREIHATPKALRDEAGTMCMEHNIHEVMYEGAGQAAAWGEFFEEAYDVSPIVCSPGKMSKEVRLRRVAPMLDHTEASPACVLFPGKAGPKLPDGSPGPAVADEDRYGWMYSQFLQFGTINRDHLLDAVTQWCNHVSTELQPGRGEVSRQVRRAVGMRGGSEAKRRMFEQDMNPTPSHERDAEAEAAYFASWN